MIEKECPQCHYQPNKEDKDIEETKQVLEKEGDCPQCFYQSEKDEKEENEEECPQCFYKPEDK